MKVLSNIWAWLDGKKTFIGLLLTALGGIANFLPQLAIQFPNAKWIVIAVGVTQFLNGWAHKAYKYKYNEEYAQNIKG